MRETPEIVKELREEEKKGSFQKTNASGLIFPQAKNPSKNENESNEKQIEKRYQMILNSTSDLVSIVNFNLKANYEYVSPSHKDLLGYDVKDLVGKSFFEFVHPDDKKNISPILKKYIKMKAKKLILGNEHKFVENLSYRIKDKKGKWHYLETTANISGNKIIAISKDVTEKKIAREELIESELQYRTIFNSSKDVFLIFDFEGNIVDANNSALEVYGYSKKDFLKLSGKDIVHPDYHHIFKKFILDVKEKGEFFAESIDVRKDGRTFPVNVIGTSFVLNGEEHLLAIVRDITKQKKDEEKLKKSEEKYKNLFNNAQVGIFRTDIKTGKVLEANNVLADFVGYKNKEELLKDNYNIAEYYENPDDRKKMLDILRRDGEIKGFEAPFKRLDGSVLWIRFSARISKNKKWIEGVSEDVTEKKKAEDKIREYSNFLDKIMQESPFAMWISDSNGTVVKTNKSLCKLLNLTPEQIVNKYNVLEDQNLKDQNVMSLVKSVFEKYTPARFSIRWKSNHVGDINFKGSRNLWIDASLFPIINSEGKLTNVICQWIDITSNKIAEKKLKDMNKELKEKVLKRTEKVEDLLKQKDEFISQLGHDLKTPLTPLNTLLPIAHKRVKDEKSKELIMVTIQNVNYMKNLVNKTLELARLNSPYFELEFENLNLFELSKNILENNKAIFKRHNINVENNIKKEIQVRADKIRLGQVLNNLIINAVKYSKDGKSGRIILDAVEDEHAIKISVKDHGVGLKDYQISKIFSEFYKTDKARSDFTSAGLGLTICKRIVQKHGGKIWAESPGAGKGSTFYFTLKKNQTERRIYD